MGRPHKNETRRVKQRKTRRVKRRKMMRSKEQDPEQEPEWPKPEKSGSR